MTAGRDGGVRPHRRQFVLGPEPVAPNADWIAEPFGDGLVLSRCPELRAARGRDAEGEAWVLLGLAVATADDAPDPVEALRRVRTRDVPELTWDWCGRWLLLGRELALTDASALLGLLWRRDRRGRLWLSSSPALVARAGGEPAAVADPRRLAHGRGVAWFPPPATRFEGVSRLLPSQALDLRASRPRPRALLTREESEAGIGTALDRLAAAVGATIRNLRRATGGPVWLGLTAGADSRAVLAAAVAAGAEIRPYTRLTPRMPVADRATPPFLAAAAGYPHRLVVDGPVPPDRRALLEAHAAGSVSEGDALPFLSGVRDDLDGVLIGGNGLEVASGYYRGVGLPHEPPSPGAGAAAFLASQNEPPASPAAAGVEAWLDWARRHPAEGLDWRDRLFFEQRQAGWLAAKEQVYDMQPGLRAPIVNCARLRARILALPERYRAAKNLQRDMVARFAPELARWPVNPPDRAFLLSHPGAVLRRVSRRAAARLRRLPPR